MENPPPPAKKKRFERVTFELEGEIARLKGSHTSGNNPHGSSSSSYSGYGSAGLDHRTPDRPASRFRSTGIGQFQHHPAPFQRPAVQVTDPYSSTSPSAPSRIPRKRGGGNGGGGNAGSGSGSGSGSGGSGGNAPGEFVPSALHIALAELRDEEGRITKEIELEKSISSCGVLHSVESNSGLQTQLRSLQMAREALEAQLNEVGGVEGADSDRADPDPYPDRAAAWFDNL